VNCELLSELFSENESRELVELIDAEAHPAIRDPRCAGIPTASFAPEVGSPGLEFLALCRGCPARVACLASELRRESDGDRAAVWFGGCGPDERAAIARHLGRRATPISAQQDRRARVARMAALGRTQLQIADELGVSRKTIQRDLTAIRAS